MKKPSVITSGEGGSGNDGEGHPAADGTELIASGRLVLSGAMGYRSDEQIVRDDPYSKAGMDAQDRIRFREHLAHQGDGGSGEGSGGGGGLLVLLAPYLFVLIVGFYVRMAPPWGYWTFIFSSVFLVLRLVYNKLGGEPGSTLMWLCCGFFPVLAYAEHWVIQLRWDHLLGVFVWAILGLITLFVAYLIWEKITRK